MQEPAALCPHNIPSATQSYAHPIRCAQHFPNLITPPIRVIVTSYLAEEFANILDALRLLLILAHHAEGGGEEFLTLLNLQ